MLLNFGSMVVWLNLLGVLRGSSCLLYTAVMADPPYSRGGYRLLPYRAYAFFITKGAEAIVLVLFVVTWVFGWIERPLSALWSGNDSSLIPKQSY